VDDSLNTTLIKEPFILSYTVKEKVAFALNYMIFHTTAGNGLHNVLGGVLLK